MPTAEMLKIDRERLKDVKLGTTVQNIRSRGIGKALERVKKTSPYIKVLIPSDRGKGVEALWAIGNVREFK